MGELITFAAIALLLVISPGPNGVLIVKVAHGRGNLASLQSISGLVVATFVHGAISILGLSALIVQSAELFMLIKLLGAAYLFYIGIKTLYQSLRQQSIRATHEMEALPLVPFHKNFSEGFLTQLLNPKVSMFYLAAFPQFIDFQASSYLGAFLLVAIHAGFIFAWFVGVTWFIAKAKAKMKHSAAGVWIQRLSGTILVYFGGLLLTQDASR